ncbi:hypothetical protein LTR95_014469 [Oleoguttula sp. CCFEE 5521]
MKRKASTCHEALAPLRMRGSITLGDPSFSGNSQTHIGDIHNNYAPQQTVAPARARSTVPFQRDKNFVPREDILDDVHNILSAPAGRAAWCGLGGVGKSQLAIEYSFQVIDRSKDTWVFWLYASNAQRLETSIRDSLAHLDVQGLDEAAVDVLKLFQRWLRDETHGRWLLILDNVDDERVLEGTSTGKDSGDLQKWSGRQLLANLTTCSHGSILVTTRSTKAAEKVVEFESSIVNVDPMNDAQSMLLLQTKVGRHCSDGEAARLASALEHMPLAMAQAAAYIKKKLPRRTVQQYLDELEKSDKSFLKELKRDEGDSRRHEEAHNSVILTWQVSFEYIRKIRPSAADLLSVMSFFDRQTIPETLLWRNELPATPSLPEAVDSLARTDSNTEDTQETQAREEKDSTEDEESDTDSSSSDKSNAERDAFQQDLETLIDYSFISIATTDPAVYEMHRLVQMSTQAWLKLNKAFERWASQFVVNLSDAFPLGHFENWAVCRPLLPHAVLALETKLGNRAALVKQSALLYNAGWFVSEQGNYALALAFNRAVLMLDEDLYGEEDENTLSCMSDLALTYRDQGRWKEAEKLQVKVLEARRRVLGEEHVDTLRSMHNLASTYWDQGRRNEAEELQVKVLEARRRVLGEEHVDTLGSMHNLASTYWDQGRWKEAEELLVKALEAKRRVLGAEHPETLLTTCNLAYTLRDLEQYDAAVDLMELAASLSAKVLGVDHPDTIQRSGRSDEWTKQDLERNAGSGSGLGSESNEEHDAVAGAAEDDDEASEGPAVGDETSSEQSSTSDACALNPSTIALLHSMKIYRISGLPGSPLQTGRREE